MRERIEIPVKLIRPEVDALAGILHHYHSTLLAAGLPEPLAAQLVLEFQSWMLAQYRLTSDAR